MAFPGHLRDYAFDFIMDSLTLLTTDERCHRIPYWSLEWERARISSKDLLSEGIKAGLLSSRKDFNEAAGEEIISIARIRELEIDDKCSQYDSVIHLASLSDIIVMALRKPLDAPWSVPEPVDIGEGLTWESGAFLAPNGEALRRIALVSSWSKDRHLSECRTWGTLGEVCAYGLPMQMIVVNIGFHRDGKYYSAWTKGFRHPVNKGLRFRRKDSKIQGFKSSWTDIWREDYDQISTLEWLSQMADDEVLPDICFKVDVPVPTDENRQRIIDLTKSKLGRIYSTKTLPEPNLSTCDWPIICSHRSHCVSGQPPSGKFGFVRIE